MKVSIVSVSRSAGLLHSGQTVYLPGWVQLERRLSSGQPFYIIRKQDRQLVIRHIHRPMFRAVYDRNRRTPIALAADQPIAETIIDRPLAYPLGFQVLHGPVKSLICRGTRQICRSSPWSRMQVPLLVMVAPSIGGASSGCTTTRTSNPYLRANSKSRWSWAGTAIMAPVPYVIST